MKKLLPPTRLFPFLTSVLILIFTIVNALIQTQQLKESYQWVNQTYKTIAHLESLVSNMSESESLWFGYLLTGNDFFLRSYTELIISIDKDIKEIRILYSDNPSQYKNLNQLILLTTGKISVQNESINLKKNKKLNRELLISKFNLGRLYLERMKVIKGRIEYDEQRLLDERQKKITNNLRNTLYSILLSFITSFIIGAFLFRFINRYMKSERKLKSELQDLNENKNKFFSIVSHDLRGPVNNILTLSELIQNENSEEEKNKLNKMVSASIKKVNDLLINLLEWASIQMNTIEIVPQLLYPHKLADENIRVLSEIAENKKIRLVNDIRQDITIWADHEMTSTVLRNLISNAIKFTNEGGKITIAANKKGDKTELSVKDNGTGMSKETMNNLFRKDIKKSGIGTANKTGSGLGLHISKEFVEKNGGYITVESELNKGTTFKFYLPAAEGKTVS